VIADPPLFVGAVHETVAEVGEATVAVTAVGAPGGPTMVTVLEVAAAELPSALVATIVK
jgi:hypothetical protein